MTLSFQLDPVPFSPIERELTLKSPSVIKIKSIISKCNNKLDEQILSAHSLTRGCLLSMKLIWIGFGRYLERCKIKSK